LKPSKPSDLTEHCVGGGLVFDGSLLKVHCDAVRLPDGSRGTREYIRHPGAVAVVALLDGGEVLLERQFRYPRWCATAASPTATASPACCG
jgi:ADP-ribose pyrophosphatase